MNTTADVYDVNNGVLSGSFKAYNLYKNPDAVIHSDNVMTDEEISEISKIESPCIEKYEVRSGKTDAEIEGYMYYIFKK